MCVVSIKCKNFRKENLHARAHHSKPHYNKWTLCTQYTSTHTHNVLFLFVHNRTEIKFLLEIHRRTSRQTTVCRCCFSAVHLMPDGTHTNKAGNVSRQRRRAPTQPKSSTMKLVSGIIAATHRLHLARPHISRKWSILIYTSFFAYTVRVCVARWRID